MTWKTLRRTAAWGLVLWALIVASFVAGCETARADDFAVPASADVQAAAEQIAVAYWGVAPAEPSLPVVWTHLGTATNAHSDWFATAANTDPATWGQESISFSYDVRWDWPKFCTVMVHEFGHLTGHVHVDDPESVMSPYYTVPVPECVAPPVGQARVVTATRPVKGAAAPLRHGSRYSARARARRAQAKLRRRHHA